MTLYSDGGAPFPPVDGTEPCTRVDPDIFFPIIKLQADQAKALCAECPVREACLAYALTHAVSGIWGGSDEHERSKVRRRENIHPVSVLSTRADPALIIRAHGRGLNNASIAQLAGTSVNAVGLVLSTWRRAQSSS